MKKLLLLFLALSGFASIAQQTYWEQHATGFSVTSNTFPQVSYADANTAWIYAADGAGTGISYQTWGRTIDGGLTWTTGAINLGSVDIHISAIHAVSATKAYIVGYPNTTSVTGGIWVTVDAGVTWTKQASALYNTIPDSFPDILHFWGTDIGVTMGDPAAGVFEIYTTSDGGTNWTRVPSANIPAPLSGEYGYTHNYEVAGGVIWFGTNKGRMYKSMDYGFNWTVAQTPLTDFGSATQSGNYSFKDATNGLLIASDFQFFRTTDGGVTWVAEVPTGYFRNFDVCFVPGTTNTYITTGTDIDAIGRGSSYSIDGGLNWANINNYDVLPVNGGSALQFFDPTHGLASGFTADSVTGGVWKWINDASTLIDPLANASFTVTSPFIASPNPTTGMLNIAGQNIAQVTVFDILGKQVMNTNFSALNTVSMNLSSLNNGVYMLKVTNDLGNTATVKVVKR